MLRIQRKANGKVVLAVSGRIDAKNVSELKSLIESEPKGRRIVLDLKEVTLVDREVVRYLKDCDSNSIRIHDCPAYIREWIVLERNEH